jgi:ubiquinone/menaquinone biosynthesis C-methylase UbiE
MRWFRKSQLDPLAVTMSGVKLGDRLLVLGGSDPTLIGALASKAGLTGRTVVLDATEAVTASTASAVERDGHLVESFTAPWSMLPFDPTSFDVVVLRDVLNTLNADDRLRCAREVHRVLRPGGRSVVIEGRAHGLLGSLIGGSEGDPHYARSGGASHVLDAAGFRAARTLAEREGQRFVEGIKANE